MQEKGEEKEEVPSIKSCMVVASLARTYHRMEFCHVPGEPIRLVRPGDIRGTKYTTKIPRKATRSPVACVKSAFQFLVHTCHIGCEVGTYLFEPRMEVYRRHQ